MNPKRYTQAAEDASQRYLNVLAALRSLLFASLAQPYSQAGVANLRAGANGVARTFLKTEVALIEDEMRRTAQDALGRAQSDLSVSPVSDIPEALDAFLEQSERFLEMEVTAQLTRDVEALVQRYREYAIETQLTAMSVRGRVGAAQVGAVDRERVRFYFRDRGGRLYPSQKFIRTVWRKALVSLGAEFYLLEAVSRGATSAIVVHPDPKHRFNGFEVSTNALSGQPSFIDVRDEIFHPQSEAVLKAVA